MWHRLQVGTAQGESCGYQWRDIDYALFAVIAGGQRPPGDADSQSRDSTELDTAAQNRPMHYLAVWNFDTNTWCADVEDPAAAFERWAQPGPGA